MLPEQDGISSLSDVQVFPGRMCLQTSALSRSHQTGSDSSLRSHNRSRSSLTQLQNAHLALPSRENTQWSLERGPAVPQTAAAPSKGHLVQVVNHRRLMRGPLPKYSSCRYNSFQTDITLKNTKYLLG